MPTSRAANSLMLTIGFIKPKERMVIVSVANCSAGLTPGKNLSIPNQTKSKPML